MRYSKCVIGRGVCAAIACLVLIPRPAPAGAEVVPVEVAIDGHSIAQITLIAKSRSSGIRFDSPGETIKLLPGDYRVEQVQLTDGHMLNPLSSHGHDWFRVTAEGPNELTVGAPLYPSVTTRRHGGFIQMEYDTVDGAGRSYVKPRDVGNDRPPPPTFTVSRGGEVVGSGSFEYG